MSSISNINSQAYLHRQIPAAPPQVPAAPDKETTNPAQSVRTALVGRSDLAPKPFGSLVSLFARGLPLPPVEIAPDSTTDTGTEAPNAVTV